MNTNRIHRVFVFFLLLSALGLQSGLEKIYFAEMPVSSAPQGPQLRDCPQ